MINVRRKTARMEENAFVVNVIVNLVSPGNAARSMKMKQKRSTAALLTKMVKRKYALVCCLVPEFLCKK